MMVPARTWIEWWGPSNHGKVFRIEKSKSLAGTLPGRNGQNNGFMINAGDMDILNHNMAPREL